MSRDLRARLVEEYGERALDASISVDLEKGWTLREGLDAGRIRLVESEGRVAVEFTNVQAGTQVIDCVNGIRRQQMARENLEGRKRGVKLLRVLGEDPSIDGRSEWMVNEKETLVWFSFHRRKLACSLGGALQNVADRMDETGSEYHLDSVRHPDDEALTNLSCTVFFEPDEMLDDEELRPAARELGLDQDPALPEGRADR